MTYFNPTVTNSSVTGCSGVAGSACPGDLFLVKTGVNDTRNNLPLSKKEFMPGSGFAYSFDQKTVIRGGYGIFFIPNYVAFGTNPYIDPVSSATSNFFASNNQGLTPASTLNENTCTDPNSSNCTLTCLGRGTFSRLRWAIWRESGCRCRPESSAQRVAVRRQRSTSFSATGYNQQKYGYIEQWNFGIQRELPGGFFADVAYAGSHGVHLPQFNTNMNQIPDSFIARRPAGFSGIAGRNRTERFDHRSACAQLIPSTRTLPGALEPGGLANGQLDRPFPQYAGLQLNGYGCCSSTYNSLQATVTKRFQGGGTMLVAYTNAKLLSNTDTLTSWLEGGTTGGSRARFRTGTTWPANVRSRHRMFHNAW